jgi:hypothetical protein
VSTIESKDEENMTTEAAAAAVKKLKNSNLNSIPNFVKR